MTRKMIVITALLLFELGLYVNNPALAADGQCKSTQPSAAVNAATAKPVSTAKATTKETTDKSEEDSIKLELKRIQLEEARLGLQDKRREARQAAEVAELEMRQKRVATQRAELEFLDAQRESVRTNLRKALRSEYTFWNEVTQESCQEAIARLDLISRAFPQQPITIILNSPGGEVTSGLALYDYILFLRHERKHHVTIRARGWAASMGGIILQAADKRIVSAESEILIHEIFSGTLGKVSHMKDDVKRAERRWHQLSKILAGRSKMTAIQIREKATKFDWWLSAKEAVELGFADAIE